MTVVEVEPTPEQQSVIDSLASLHHLVVVEKFEVAGALKLIPADFCWRCGGDGFVLDEFRDEHIDCPECEGTGGKPNLHPPVIVLGSGTELPR